MQKANLGLRIGQCMFNLLYDIDPDSANRLRATSLDPFHRDDRIPAFLDKSIRLDVHTQGDSLMTFLTKLNAYNGDNIWQDIIFTLPGFDQAATDKADVGYSSDRLVAGGVEYRFDGQDGLWVVVA